MEGSSSGPLRRNVLSAALTSGAALVAGCLGSATIGSRRGEPPADATRAVEVTSVAPFAPWLPVDASVYVVRPWMTPNQPPAIEIGLTNRSVLRYHTFFAGSGGWGLLADRASDRVEPGVALLGEEEHAREWAADRAPDGCWKLVRSTNNPLLVKYSTQLAPLETTSMQFEVWGHHENADGVCLPTGEFTFSETYTVKHYPDQPTFEWEFSLRIKAVG